MGKTIFKLTEEEKQQLVSLYNQGLTDKQIAENLGNITDGTVYYWRKRLNLQTKFDYSQISKINKEKFKELFDQGLSDSKIAEMLGVSYDGIYAYRKRNGYERENYSIAKPRELSQFQKEVLIGTLLGDSSIILAKDSINPSISCAHSPAQKEYCEYKTSIFENIGARCIYSKRKTPDKRTGKFYEAYTMRLPANPVLKDWYNQFYPNGKKVIPKGLLQYFTQVSLAFMFMDDGAKIGKHGYIICTNCFILEDINIFREMLKDKFNLDTTVFKNNVIYIRTYCQKLFENLISSYLCNCMKYKLHVS